MRRALAIALGVGMLAACESKPRDLALRLPTRSYRFIIKADPTPPYANEEIRYTVTVLDRRTEQPIQHGEGQIYGQLTERGRPYTSDAFTYGPEVGTYHAKLRFAIATLLDPNESWQMGLRFRRDSLSPVEVTHWSQQVRPERDTKAP